MMTLPTHLQKFTEPMPRLDKGHVRLVDVMGDDTAIVQAARVSYGLGASEHKWGKLGPDQQERFCNVCGEGESGPSHCVEGDRRLIRYLLRHGHTTPFEMCEIKLHVRVPMDAWRQWIRHRTANVNEFSTRYSEVPLVDEGGNVIGLAETPPDRWRLQSKSSKQGSSGAYASAAFGSKLTKAERSLHQLVISTYNERLEHGVAKEQARKDLPLSTYTEAYWKIDLHNLLHFLRLRMDMHAQLEIRTFADAIAQIVKAWVPQAWEAFEDYRLHGAHLSRMEKAVLRRLVNTAWSVETMLNPESKYEEQLRTCRETDEWSQMSMRERREFVHAWIPKEAA